VPPTDLNARGGWSREAEVLCKSVAPDDEGKKKLYTRVRCGGAAWAPLLGTATLAQGWRSECGHPRYPGGFVEEEAGMQLTRCARLVG